MTASHVSETVRSSILVLFFIAAASPASSAGRSAAVTPEQAQTPAPAQAGSPGAEPKAKTANTLTRATPDATGPAATIADAAWLMGDWTGDGGLGGSSTEHWSTPSGGAMPGLYRLVRDGKVVFYELMLITESQGTLALKLKHFNADLTGWEEKDKMVTFPLVKVTPDRLFFDGLTYAREGDRLRVYLALREKDGTLHEELFDFARPRR
jgi:Domain of unknown function (DUF6265)